MEKSKAAITGGILGGIYTIYLIMNFGSSIAGSSNNAEALGGAIAGALVMPHMILVLLGSVFTIIGGLKNKAGFALAGGILFSVGAAAFFMYAIFVVPMIVLSFVGYSKIKKIKVNI